MREASRTTLQRSRADRGGKEESAPHRAKTRLWELFLVEILKFPWDEIDEEAERLEHFMSKNWRNGSTGSSAIRNRDPHGDTIPTPDGIIKTRIVLPLLQLFPERWSK